MALSAEQRTLLEQRLAQLEDNKPSRLGSGIQGGAQGFTLGFGDEIMGGLTGAGSYAISRVADVPGYSEKGLGDIYKQERDKIRIQNKKAQEANPGSYLTGYIGGAVANPVKFKGGAITQAGQYGATAALGESEADNVTDMALDTAKGGAFGLATGTVLKGASKIVKPIAKQGVSAARKGAAAALKRIGIDDLTPGQLTGNKALQTTEGVMDDMLTTAGAARVRKEGQLRKFTAAVLKKAGIEADEVSPAVLAQAEAGFEQSYKAMTAGKTIKIDDKTLSVVGEVERKLLGKLPSTTKPIIRSYIKDIKAAGQMSGEVYQETRSLMTKQARSMLNTDPASAAALQKLRNALDDAAERALPASEKGAWRILNNQYRNYKTIQQAASSPSKNTLEGLLSPAALLRAVQTSNKSKSQKGYGELYDLARSGRLLLADSIPSSGTAERQLAQRILTLGGAGTGTGLLTYGFTGDPEQSLKAGGLAATGLLVAPKLAQKALSSKAAQTYFTQGIPGLQNLANLPAGAKQAITRGISSASGSSAVTNETPQAPAQPQTLTPETRQLLQQRLQELEGGQQQLTPETRSLLEQRLKQLEQKPQSSIHRRMWQQESGNRQFNEKGETILGPPVKVAGRIERAVGKTQVLPSTGPEAAKLAGLPWDKKRLYEDESYNEALGTAYYNKQLQNFGNETLALMAYNWGPGNVRSWLKSGAKPGRVPKETRDYVRAILGTQSAGSKSARYAGVPSMLAKQG